MDEFKSYWKNLELFLLLEEFTITVAYKGFTIYLFYSSLLETIKFHYLCRSLGDHIIEPCSKIDQTIVR